MRFDAIFVNGRFHTGLHSRNRVNAVGVHNGRIISLDDDIPTDRFRSVHDLRNAVVVPGFNDAHHHLVSVGLAMRQVDLRPSHAGSMDALLSAIAAASAHADEHAWVIGAGYDQNYLGAHPTAEDLDRVARGRPVYLVHASRHMGVANTRAFELAGFPGRLGVPVPPGGAVPVDASGRAIGLLEETAKSIVTEHIPAANADHVAEYVAAGSAAALAVGITSITDPGLGAPDHLGISKYDIAGYQLARDRGQLGVRATVMPYLTTLHRHDDVDTGGHPHYGLDHGVRSGWGDQWLRLGAVKVLSDGSLIGRSAYMREDYEADALAGCANHGYLQFPESELRERLVGAHLAGWQLAVHAIGDAALDVAIDIVEEAQRIQPRSDARHRIEHVCMASDAQLARMRSVGLLAIPQGRFVYELGDGVLRALGTGRSRLAYRMKALLDAGLEVAASTDAPVVSANPLLNIHDMVNRRTAGGAAFNPEERITVQQAIRAYTAGSAYASHQENEKGCITPGMLADFVVLSQDLFGIPAEEIAGTTVTATVVGGGLAYGDL